jgi:hypothetical protein
MVVALIEVFAFANASIGVPKSVINNTTVTFIYRCFIAVSPFNKNEIKALLSHYCGILANGTPLKIL